MLRYIKLCSQWHSTQQRWRCRHPPSARWMFQHAYGSLVMTYSGMFFHTDYSQYPTAPNDIFTFHFHVQSGCYRVISLKYTVVLYSRVSASVLQAQQPTGSELTPNRPKHQDFFLFPTCIPQMLSGGTTKPNKTGSFISVDYGSC